MRLKCQKMLLGVGREQLDWPASDGISIGELLGLILIDLDRLSSRDPSAPAPFAVAFMDKRLARRLAVKYPPEALGDEIDRRFAAVTATTESGTEPQFGRRLEKLNDRLGELSSALKRQRRSP